MMNDRACDQLGEKGHKERIIEQIKPFNLAVVSVHEKSDFLEYEE